MPFAIGGFAAMVALAAGILATVDPMTLLGRAALAFAVGWIGAAVWQALVASQTVSLEAIEVSEASPGEPETS